MADQPQQQPQPLSAPPASSGRGPGASKGSFVARAAAAVAARPYVSFAVIVVLVILVIGMYVYYHGFLFLGPYAAGRAGFRGKRRKEAGGAEGDSDEQGDPETERLIESINRK